MTQLFGARFSAPKPTALLFSSKPTSTVELASAPTQLNLQGPSLAKTPFCSPVPVCVFLLSKGPPPQMGKVLGPTHSGSLPVATRVQHTACSIDASVGFLSSEHPPWACRMKREGRAGAGPGVLGQGEVTGVRSANVAA